MANNIGFFVLIDTGKQEQRCQRWNFHHFSERELLIRLVNSLSG
jgi:hypothetical protein